MSLRFIIYPLVICITTFNIALSYQENLYTPVDLNQSTKAIDKSLRELIDNVLKSFAPGQDLNIKNIPSLPRLDSLSKVPEASGEQFFTPANISTQGFLGIAIEFIKLSVNLLFVILGILIEILKGILGAVDSYKS